MEGINKLIFKDLLLYWEAAIPYSSFMDGMVMGVLLAQDYSKFENCIKLIKDINYKKKEQLASSEALAEHYSVYIEYMIEIVKPKNNRLRKAMVNETAIQTEEWQLQSVVKEESK